MNDMKELRKFLKAVWWDERDKVETDRMKKIAPPPPQKPCPPGASLTDLLAPERMNVRAPTVFAAIQNRQTHRKFGPGPLTMAKLSFLLWATQGVREVDRMGRIMRTVPSAGGRHPFETYLIVNRVQGLMPGIYRYLPLEHKLCPIDVRAIAKERITEAFRGQSFTAESAVLFVWTVIPYRSEWQYLMVAPKLIALDAGHICQNLYLACEAVVLGACALGLYDQKKLDDLVGVDGEEEFSVYAASVGEVPAPASPVRRRREARGAGGCGN